MEKDISITALSLNLDKVLYSTYLGGNNYENINSFSFDIYGRMIIAGSTKSDDYPTSQFCYDSSYNGDYDGFFTLSTKFLVTNKLHTMKKPMRKIFILLVLMIPTLLFEQKDSTQLFEPAQIKVDIDTSIYTLMDVHPTFLNHYKTNNLESAIDSIKNNINNPMSALDFFRLMQPIVTIDGHTSLRYTGPLCPNEDNPLFQFKVLVY